MKPPSLYNNKYTKILAGDPIILADLDLKF